jgi:hypothetical protein
MDPIEQISNLLVAFYAVIIAYIAGWFTPRGVVLRTAQLWVLRKIHNFLAWEDEKIVDAIENAKTKIRKSQK